MWQKWRFRDHGSVQLLRLALRRLKCSLAPADLMTKLKKRGLVENQTKIQAAPPPKSCGVYVGFDPTADSLHTGNLLAIVTLLHFQRHGYQPIAVLGGATGVVGDPSGRSRERDELASDLLEINKAGLRENLQRIFDNGATCFGQDLHHSQPVKILDNADWWRDMRAVEFVTSIARHFRLGTMLGKDSVKLRMDSDEGMNCAEFLYPIFQSYDFLHLHRHNNCWMEVGGGDQWGNIVAGVAYVKRVAGSIVHGMTFPLLTSSTGEKLGKSAGNAVWLSPEKLSPYQFYQDFVRTTDQDVEEKLRAFTLLELEEIRSIMEQHERYPPKFIAQKCLAENVTRLVHGGGELRQLFQDAPCSEVTVGTRRRSIVEVTCRAGIFSSEGEAESMVRKGGLYINFERVRSTDELFCQEQHILADDTTLVRIGKKNFRLIKWKH